MVVHESINIFGGFAPFPNTIMIPTMGLQSDVIGFRFGFGYEKGKRTLRAMSNEQFNNLNEEAEQAIYKIHDTTAINFFVQELNTWTQLQHNIINKSVEIEVMKAQRTPSAMAEIIQAMNTAVSEQGATVTWENLAETWNNFFGGGQVFNNYVNTSGAVPPPTPESGGRTPGQPRPGTPTPGTPTPGQPTPGTDPKHISSHNDILTMYDENRILEQQVLAWVTEYDKQVARNAGGIPNTAKVLAQKIENGKRRLLEVSARLGAMQASHQSQYGHQVFPFSQKL